jgi:hypothetical protein
MEKKIELSQLKNYLGTGLNVYIDGYGEGPEILITINSDSEEIDTNVDCATLDIVRPICYRLSDLDKFIPELGFVPINELIKQDWSDAQIALLKMGAYTHTAFGLMEWVFKNHFWPFGDEYFEQGLIIDKLKTT